MLRSILFFLLAPIVALGILASKVPAPAARVADLLRRRLAAGLAPPLQPLSSFCFTHPVVSTTSASRNVCTTQEEHCDEQREQRASSPLAASQQRPPEPTSRPPPPFPSDEFRALAAAAPHGRLGTTGSGARAAPTRGATSSRIYIRGGDVARGGARGVVDGERGTNAVRMADISEKTPTHRRATAECRVVVNSNVMARLKGNSVAKGDVLTVSQLAGIMGAKNTPQLLPLCHPALQLNCVEVEVHLLENVEEDHLTNGEKEVRVRCSVSTFGNTGVEMEALVGCSAAGLNIIDMCKPIQKDIRIKDLRLLRKSGGKSGDWVAGRLAIGVNNK